LLLNLLRTENGLRRKVQVEAIVMGWPGTKPGHCWQIHPLLASLYAAYAGFIGRFDSDSVQIRGCVAERAFLKVSNFPFWGSVFGRLDLRNAPLAWPMGMSYLRQRGFWLA
jgi:hypothetical protein